MRVYMITCVQVPTMVEEGIRSPDLTLYIVVNVLYKMWVLGIELGP